MPRRTLQRDEASIEAGRTQDGGGGDSVRRGCVIELLQRLCAVTSCCGLEIACMKSKLFLVSLIFYSRIESEIELFSAMLCQDRLGCLEIMDTAVDM